MVATRTPALDVHAPAASAQFPSRESAVAQIWAWLQEVPDPEIPVISIVDLGIVRDVAWHETDTAAVVTITPTYSGCPANDVIAEEIRKHLGSRGIPRVELQVKLSPAWTTDWMSDRGKECLRAYGIAPPTTRSAAATDVSVGSLAVAGQHVSAATVCCPRCGSSATEMLSQFGSTPCKSIHRCLDCLEPFEHFKCH